MAPTTSAPLSLFDKPRTNALGMFLSLTDGGLSPSNISGNPHSLNISTTGSSESGFELSIKSEISTAPKSFDISFATSSLSSIGQEKSGH